MCSSDLGQLHAHRGRAKYTQGPGGHQRQQNSRHQTISFPLRSHIGIPFNPQSFRISALVAQTESTKHTIDGVIYRIAQVFYDIFNFINQIFGYFVNAFHDFNNGIPQRIGLGHLVDRVFNGLTQWFAQG